MKTLIIYKSIHHQNTKKVAETIAKVFRADLVEVDQIQVNSLPKYDLIGFGSGIYYWNHHQSLINFINKLSKLYNKNTFIFSTSGMRLVKLFFDHHRLLRNILQFKGFKIIGEFNCLGWDSYPWFTRPLGGINKGRPNNKDLERAKKFSHSLIDRLSF